jgi:hypothetical protein
VSTSTILVDREDVSSVTSCNLLEEIEAVFWVGTLIVLEDREGFPLG